MVFCLAFIFPCWCNLVLVNYPVIERAEPGSIPCVHLSKINGWIIGRPRGHDILNVPRRRWLQWIRPHSHLLRRLQRPSERFGELENLWFTLDLWFILLRQWFYLGIVLLWPRTTIFSQRRKRGTGVGSTGARTSVAPMGREEHWTPIPQLLP